LQDISKQEYLSRTTMILAGRVASVQLTDRSRRESWPIELGYPPPTNERWKSAPQHPRMLTLNSLCCWGREATRVHEMMIIMILFPAVFYPDGIGPCPRRRRA